MSSIVCDHEARVIMSVPQRSTVQVSDEQCYVRRALLLYMYNAHRYRMVDGRCG